MPSPSAANTIARLLFSYALWLICRTTLCALSMVLMNGSRTWRGFISNCLKMALPKVSAVMPVPSETKKTVRLVIGTGRTRCSGN